MDLFEKKVYQMFFDAGVDISNKKLSDAKMPLYIVASNITKRIPAVLSGEVSVISALKCSRWKEATSILTGKIEENKWKFIANVPRC